MKGMKSVFCALLLAGCATTDNKAAMSYEGCTYPDAPQSPAPSWICEQSVQGLKEQAVGYAKKMASGPGVMKDVAAVEARAELTRRFSEDVSSKLERVNTESTDDALSKVHEDISRIQKGLSSMTLSHSRIYRTQTSPTGGLFVLVGLDNAAYDANVDALVNNAVDGQSPELYQKFLKEEGDATLEDIKKKSGQ
ncbi:MAG: LPP20 family lipoprotein [Pseudomonadota bacterium]|uniref:LPP20 family lipoprotein n=1 Tax=Gallaecimonas pentaromativorans TaxID=584787 RepID=UPI00067F059E|nr:LPP20 family lipoprotein [Gallaecimonas pentaromativorans]MED5523657.1 LPP20 family lipoprotein [Pseudomonadota bacterium]